MKRVTKEDVDELAYKIIGCAIEVHKNLGPGLLESIYEACLVDELKQSGFSVRSQVYLPIKYKGKIIEGNLRLDIVVENLIIIELKAVVAMIPLFEAQLLTYLKLTSYPKGILINFNSTNITTQLKSFVSESYAKLD